MEQNDTLSPRKRRAILALLSEKHTQAAAAAARVGRTTLHRWMADPAFRQALSTAEGQAIDAATRRLIATASQAVETLIELAKSAQSEAVRRAAADTILTHLLKLRELRTLEERVSELERKIGNGKH